MISLTVDAKHYRLVPLFSNGRTGEAISLRPLFAQYRAETGEDEP